MNPEDKPIYSEEELRELAKRRAHRGEHELESAVAAHFSRYIPGKAPDESFLTIADSYFRSHQFVTSAIESYEQAFDVIATMIPHQFRTRIVGRSKDGDTIELIFWYENIQFIPPSQLVEGKQILPITPSLAVLHGQTYACHMRGDFHAIMTRIETADEHRKKSRELIANFLQRGGSPISNASVLSISDRVDLSSRSSRSTTPASSKTKTTPPPPSETPVEEKEGGRLVDANVTIITDAENPNRIEVIQVGALQGSLPIMVGSKYCTTTALKRTPSESWAQGEDPNMPGGYIILDGRAMTCGSLYSHAPNHPMSMSKLKASENIAIYATIMTRRDPFFGNTFQLAPTITIHNEKLPGKQILKRYDVCIEIMWNQPDMNPKEVGNVKAHLSRVPIYALFSYYGCNSHEEMCRYIFPNVPMSDARVRFLRDAISNGPLHKAFFNHARPVTDTSSLLYIGECIISEDAKRRYKAEAEAEIPSDMAMSPENRAKVIQFLYETKLSAKAKTILDGTFFFNVNKDKRKVCLSMASIIAHLIRIFFGIDEPTDRNNLAFNRVQTVGEQFVGESKRYIKKDLIDPIIRQATMRLFNTATWEGMKTAFPTEITSANSTVGNKFSTSMRRAFKSVSKTQGQQARLVGEAYDPKSILFILSKINESAIRPTTGDKGTSITFIRRQVHQSHALLICPAQSPESGADVGRYHQLTIFAGVTRCSYETDIRDLLQMKERAHPTIEMVGIVESADADDDGTAEE